MESRTVSTSITIFIFIIGLANSDLDKDREECYNTLIGLSTCLPYVGGDAKAPTPTCCTGLKQVLAKDRKCLCLLVKDRDDPKLGFKINGTLTLGLPDLCQSPANISSCTDLLHLAPNSSDAKFFEQYVNSTKATGKGSSSAAASASASVPSKNDDGQLIKWLGMEVIYGLLFTSFVTYSFL